MMFILPSLRRSGRRIHERQQGRSSGLALIRVERPQGGRLPTDRFSGITGRTCQSASGAARVIAHVRLWGEGGHRNDGPYR